MLKKSHRGDISSTNPTDCLAIRVLQCIFVTFVLYYIIVTVDYEKNSNADTGLFMKVEPEKWKTPDAVRRLGSVTAAINSGNSYNSPAVAVDRGGNIFNSTVAAAVQPAPFTTGYHNQWMDSVNKKLAALRLRINARKTPDDRGFICSKPHNT